MGHFCKLHGELIYESKTPVIKGGSWGGPVVRKMGRPRGEIFTKKEVRHRVEGTVGRLSDHFMGHWQWATAVSGGRGAGSLEEVAPLSTEGPCDPGEVVEGKGQLPREEEGCGRAGSRKMELSVPWDENMRHGHVEVEYLQGGASTRDQEK